MRHVLSLLVFVSLAACSTIISDRPPGHDAGQEPIDRGVSVGIEFLDSTKALAKTNVSVVDAGRIFGEVLERAGIFRRMVDMGAESAQDVHAGFRIVAIAREPDALQHVKMYGTVLTGLLLSPFIEYRDTITVVGDLELIARNPQIRRRYVAKGSAVLSRGLFETARFSLEDAALRAAIESVSAKLVDDLRRDAELLRVLAQPVDHEPARPGQSRQLGTTPAEVSERPSPGRSPLRPTACAWGYYLDSVSGRCLKIGE